MFTGDINCFRVFVSVLKSTTAFSIFCYFFFVAIDGCFPEECVYNVLLWVCCHSADLSLHAVVTRTGELAAEVAI